MLTLPNFRILKNKIWHSRNFKDFKKLQNTSLDNFKLFKKNEITKHHNKYTNLKDSKTLFSRFQK